MKKQDMRMKFAIAAGLGLVVGLVLVVVEVAFLCRPSLRGMYKGEQKENVITEEKTDENETTALAKNEQENEEETYTVEQLTNLCLTGQYNNLVEVCKYKETSTNLLCLVAQTIGEKSWTWETESREKALELLTKLEMLILEHPNCNKQVLFQMIGIANPKFAPILIQDERNDSWLLMIWAESCEYNLEYATIIANHEAANVEVLERLIEIAEEKENNELKAVLERQLRTLQGT